MIGRGEDLEPSVRSDSTSLRQTLFELEAGLDKGSYLGGQMFVSQRGTKLLDTSFGEARPGEAMTSAHLPIWFSTGKPIAAIAIAQLWERRLLELDDLVSRFVPEFAAGGKQDVSLRHLLTHTGGFRMLDLKWPESSWEEIIVQICQKRLEPRWVPGATAGYHRTSSWFMLGEIVRRVDGRTFETYVREELFLPLGMKNSWIGMPADRYRRYEDLIAPLFDTDTPEPRITRWHSEQWVTSCSPGANARGPIRELAALYEMLRAGGTHDGVRILTPQTVEAFTARHRVGLYDKTFQAVLDWGLGFMKNSAHYGVKGLPYSFGRYASDRVFGHSGYRSSIAFSDPTHHLVVALAVNGTPSELVHQRFVQKLLDTLYGELDPS